VESALQALLKEKYPETILETILMGRYLGGDAMMAEQRHKDQTAKSGIAHFPLEEEQDRQEKVHENASGRGEAPSAGSRRGHRMSRQTDPPPVEESDERVEGRGGKGGKTGGSRTGLLSASSKEQKGRT
jgi:hypothetical protein